MNLGSTLGTTRTSAYVVQVVNPTDASADPEAVRALVGRQRDAGNRVTVYELPATISAPHEYLDPEDPQNKAGETFPALVEILTTGTTGLLTAS
jgi:hypothetical protein